MAARYKGRKSIRLANGRIVKQNDIVNEITDEQAKVLKQWEPVNEPKKELKKKSKEHNDE